MTHRNHVGMMQLFEKLELAHSRNINAVTRPSSSHFELFDSYFGASFRIPSQKYGGEGTFTDLVDFFILRAYLVVQFLRLSTGHSGVWAIQGPPNIKRPNLGSGGIPRVAPLYQQYH